MNKIWGYQIPWNCSMKSDRSCVKRAKLHSCLIDESYYEFFIVEDSQTVIEGS